jgi:AcrR family transcriptional regulator
MSARAEAAERTAEAILLAAVDLWREMLLDDITLNAIAERAGTSLQSVIRHFGSKEGVFAACIERDPAGIRRARDRAPAGDVETAVDALLQHYERDGPAVLRTLAIENRLDAARAVAEAGRRDHRAWCARVFEPYLSPAASDGREARLDAFVAATDLYLWRLLRRDLGRSLSDTRNVMLTLVAGLIGDAV